jgi:hypothetical protein
MGRLISLRFRTNKSLQVMRQNKGSEEELERGCRVTWSGWNPWISVAEAENSGELLVRMGGVSGVEV